MVRNSTVLCGAYLTSLNKRLRPVSRLSTTSGYFWCCGCCNGEPPSLAPSGVTTVQVRPSLGGPQPPTLNRPASLLSRRQWLAIMSGKAPGTPGTESNAADVLMRGLGIGDTKETTQPPSSTQKPGETEQKLSKKTDGQQPFENQHSSNPVKKTEAAKSVQTKDTEQMMKHQEDQDSPEKNDQIETFAAMDETQSNQEVGDKKLSFDELYGKVISYTTQQYIDLCKMFADSEEFLIDGDALLANVVKVGQIHYVAHKQPLLNQHYLYKRPWTALLVPIRKINIIIGHFSLGLEFRKIAAKGLFHWKYSLLKPFHLGPYLKGECINQKAKPHK